MKRSPHSERRRLAVAVLLPCLLAVATSQAQLFKGGLFNRKEEAPRNLTEEEIGVPVPVTGRVEALKGHEITFEIRAESKTPGATVEFLIRAFPSAGKIVSMVSKPNERNKALVTYWADPSSSATNDVFSFAVRYRGGRYSAETRYDIDLVDLKTEIQVPSEMDFGQVMVGGEAVRELTVRNLGGGPMERQIFLAPPWHLLDPADGKVNLGPRGARVLKVAFRPELMGETSYFLSFSRSKEGTTKLLGTGGDPFQIVTETIELVLDPVSGERRGEIELGNPGEKAVIVEARASTRLQAGLFDEYALAPGRQAKVAVKLGATDIAPFDGTVEFFLKNGYSKSARVVAPVVPARLTVSVPGAISGEVINFGQVEAGRSTERGIVVTNRGGVAVPLEFHVPEPFRLLTNPGPQLAPLTSIQLSIGLFPAAAQRGLVDVTMNVRSHEQTLPIRLLGNVVTPAGGSRAPTGQPAPKGFRLGGGGAKPVPVAAVDPANGASPATSPVSSPPRVGAGDGADRLEPSELPGRRIDPTLRRPEDLSVLKTGSENLEIGWTAPRDSDGADFEIELRGFPLDAGPGESGGDWTPHSAVEIERIDRLVKAKVERLRPMRRYELRVVLANGDGRVSPPSETIVATTSRKMDWAYVYPVLGIGVLVVLGFAIRGIRAGRR